MRGSKSILALVILVLVLGAVSAVAQEYAKPTNKTGSGAVVIPPVGTVRYDAIVYLFRTEAPIGVRFESLGGSLVALQVKATAAEPTACTVQWATFPPIELNLGDDGTGSFILNTETGYAEK